MVANKAAWCAACGALVALAGCDRKTVPDAAPSPSSSVFKPAAPVASGLPGSPERVSKIVNPENKPAYSGPTGAVRGLVTASGDPAPEATEHLAKITGACPEAREMYGKLFREGMMRSLADVLVAVTGYEGYVPEKHPDQLVAARGCAFSTRTVALTFGQTLLVQSKDRDAYAPSLLGAKMQAQLLALPGGVPSKLYPPSPGHYVLTDDMKLFMMADVFVLKYATHDVTGLDGRYAIDGIPAGKARISALLPGTEVVVEKDIEIKPGQTIEVALELRFDAKANEARRAAAAATVSAAAAARSARAAGSAAPPPRAP